MNSMKLGIRVLYFNLVTLFRMKEKEVYRAVRKDMRAKNLLRQSRLPFSKQKPQFARRSMSATDLARTGFQEHAFKPKINRYYVPNYDKLHSKLMRSMEQTKRTRSPTKCKPFLLYTNMIPSKKDKILDDIRNDAEMRHSETFKIKGKQMPIKSASLANLSASHELTESIPTKTTEAQRLREAVGKKKRRDEHVENQFAETSQRSKSANERRVRARINERARLQDQSTVAKAKREDKVKHNLFF
jgi:protein FAM161A